LESRRQSLKRKIRWLIAALFIVVFGTTIAFYLTTLVQAALWTE